MTGHVVTVQKLEGGPGQGTKFYAACLCGWCGRLRDTRAEVAPDSTSHIAAATRAERQAAVRG